MSVLEFSLVLELSLILGVGTSSGSKTAAGMSSTRKSWVCLLSGSGHWMREAQPTTRSPSSYQRRALYQDHTQASCISISPRHRHSTQWPTKTLCPDRRAKSTQTCAPAGVVDLPERPITAHLLSASLRRTRIGRGIRNLSRGDGYAKFWRQS